MKYYYDKVNLLSIFSSVTDRDSVRKIMNLKYRCYKKSFLSKNTSDFFGKAEVMCEYDLKNNLTAVELYYPEAQLFYDDFQLLGINVKELTDFLKDKKKSYIYNNLSLISDKMHFYIPNYDDEMENAIVESVYLKLD